MFYFWVKKYSVLKYVGQKIIPDPGSANRVRGVPELANQPTSQPTSQPFLPGVFFEDNLGVWYEMGTSTKAAIPLSGIVSLAKSLSHLVGLLILQSRYPT